MLRQIFQSRTNLQHQLGASISRSNSFLEFSARHFSTALSPVEEVERLPNEDTPWLMLNPEIDKATGDKMERFYSPGEKQMVKMNRKRCLKASNSAKCVGSTTGGWLGYVDPYDCSVFLSNPYLNDVVQLPSVTTLPSVVDVKHDRSTGAVVGLKQAFYSSRQRAHWLPPLDFHSFIAKLFTNMAMSRDESVVLAIQGYPRRAVYCSIGYDGINDNNSSSFEWAGLHEDYDPGFSYNQAVYSSKHNLFYTLFASAGIQAFDLETDMKNRSKLVQQFFYSYGRNTHAELKKNAKKDENKVNKLLDPDRDDSVDFYLVPACQLHPILLKRYIRNNRLDSDSDDESGDSKAVLAPHETYYFEVFRVDLEEHKLERMDDLDDLSLFIGNNQSFSLNADEIPGIRPNCIYFSDDCYDRSCGNWGFDYGIFDLSDNSVLPLGCEEDHEKVPFSSEYNQFWVAPRLHFN